MPSAPPQPWPAPSSSGVPNSSFGATGGAVWAPSWKLSAPSPYSGFLGPWPVAVVIFPTLDSRYSGWVWGAGRGFGNSGSRAQVLVLLVPSALAPPRLMASPPPPPGVRMGSLGLFLQCAISLLFSLVMDRLVQRFGTRAVYLASVVAFPVAAGATCLSRSVAVVTASAALTGVTFSALQILPYTLASLYHREKQVLSGAGGREGWPTGPGQGLAREAGGGIL